MNIYTIHIIMLLSFSLELSHTAKITREKKFFYHKIQAASKILLEVPQVGFYIKKLVNSSKSCKNIKRILKQSAFDIICKFLSIDFNIRSNCELHKNYNLLQFTLNNFSNLLTKCQDLKHSSLKRRC